MHHVEVHAHSDDVVRNYKVVIDPLVVDVLEFSFYFVAGHGVMANSMLLSVLFKQMAQGVHRLICVVALAVWIKNKYFLKLFFY